MTLNVLAKGRATSTSDGGRLFGRSVFQRIVILLSNTKFTFTTKLREAFIVF